MGPFRPIAGIENRAPQEVFDIMCERFRSSRNEVIELCAKVIDERWEKAASHERAADNRAEARNHHIAATEASRCASSIRSLKDHSNG